MSVRRPANYAELTAEDRYDIDCDIAYEKHVDRLADEADGRDQ